MPLAPLIDAHAHLTDERLRSDAAERVRRAAEREIVGVVTVGSDLDDSRAAVSLAETLPGVWATVGVHPNSTAEAAPDAADALQELARHPAVVGIGETGLDYHYDFAPRPVQREWFRLHLDIARASGLPVVVHCRDAEQDLGAMLAAEAQGTRGVLHSFAAGRALLDRALELGWFISFSGMVTFRNFAGAELVRAVPDDRILVETDSPYLAPAPHRGKTNEPAFVRHVAERVAELRGEDPADFAALALRNTRALFGRIPPP